MKSYSEFMEYIKENVTDYLPERFESAEITIRQVVKNNDVVLDGLLISSPDTAGVGGKKIVSANRNAAVHP